MNTPVEFFRTRSPAAQIALIGAGVVLTAVVLGIVYFLLLRPRYDVLFTNLRTADAATIVAQLEAKKTPYRLTDGGTTILAPEAMIDAARLDVMSTELPLKGMVGFELFNKSDMGLTEFAQKINYQRALQGELARTIMTIEAIDAARVHLTIPETTIFRADRRPPKASVTIIPRTGQIVPPGTIEGIQRLVAAAVTDLDVANVVVLDAHGALVSGAIETPNTASPGLQQSRAVEQFYEAQVRAVLAPLYPDAQPTVIIPADQWAQAAVGSDPRSAALEAWRAGARTFRLDVRIATSQILTPNDQQDIRALVEQAVGLTDQGADAVTFARADAPVSETPLSAATAVSPAEPTPSLRPATRWPWATLVGLAALIGLAALLYLRRPRARLSAEELDDYAKRLARALDEEAAHGAAPL